MHPLSYRHRIYLLRTTLFIFLLFMPLFVTLLTVQPTFAQDQPTARSAAQGVAVTLQELARNGGEDATVSYSRATGLVSFLRLAPTAPLAAAQAQSADPTTRAAAFLTQYGGLFGITDPARQLHLSATTTDVWGGVHVRYDQRYAGVEVYGAQLRVHFDGNGRLIAVNGALVPEATINTTPTYTTEMATAIALATVQKANAQRQLSLNLAVRQSKLYLYRTGLAQGIPGRNHLAYEVAVTNPQRTIHELVYVDAHNGQILDQISLVKSIDRKIYNGALEPAALVWAEGDPLPYSGPDAVSINKLIDFSADTYNLFASLSGGSYLSFDGADATMHSVLLPDDPFFCPNAFWDGEATNYCPGVDGDDTVAHEWTHAYTEFTHNLIYQWQPGALNEAYSDIFGEVVDLLNGAGLDQPDALRTTGACSLYSDATVGDDSYRWLSGEDDVGFGGAIRDLWNPTCYGNAGKVSDELYWCSRFDGGGVHSNSGVPNHAFALLVDGGEYNGQTINGIGLTKASHLYWHTATAYQTPATQFSDHADALEAACTDLATTGAELPGLSTESPTPFGSGERMTTADCAEVSKVIAAVELRAEPVQCNFQPLLNPTAPALCEGQGAVQTIALSDWETGLGAWTVGRRDIVNPETFSYADWQVIGDLPVERSGQALFADNDPTFGNCSTDLEAGVRYVESPLITIPNDVVVPHIALDHLINTEYRWDGGNLKLSVNGGPWKLIQRAAFTFNGYNDALIPPGISDDPLAGEASFTGDNPNFIAPNWGQSQISLAGLAQAGDEIRLRIELGTDSCFGLSGWHVDDVRVYACSAEQPPAPTNPIFYFSSSTSGKVAGLRFKDEDILAYDTVSEQWAIYFDGSDVGVDELDTDAFEVLPNGALILSFDRAATIDGLPVDDADIVLFTPTTLGEQTAGAFSLYLVGAEEGLTTDSEDIDAISFTPEGFLALSTNGKAKTPALQAEARDEDLLLVNGAPLPYFVGGNVGLTKDSEDIGASWIDPLTGKLYLATRGSFKLKDGLRGHEDDLWVCDPSGLWHQTACQSYKLWDGDAGLRNERIDGFSTGAIWPTTTVSAAQATTAEEVEAEEELIDADDVAEEGGTQEEEAAALPFRSLLPLIQR
ncbi:MAG: M4 family metallopeptidase [Caldilineaceae bacterium]